MTREKYSSAIKNATRAHQLSAQFDFEIGNTGRIHHVMSSGLEGIGAFKDAIYYRKKGMNWQIDNNPNFLLGQGIYFSLSRIGSLFLNIEEYDSSLVYFNKALKYSDITSKPRLISGMYNNIGITYYKLEELDSAQLYYYKALKLYDEIDNKNAIDSFMVSLIGGNIADCLADNNPLKEKYYIDDINSCLSFGDYQNMIKSSISYANYLMANKKFAQSKQVLTKSLDIVNDNVIPTLVTISLHKAFTVLYIKTGNEIKASYHFNKLIIMLDNYYGAAAMEKYLEAHSSYKLSEIESELSIEKIQGEKKIAQINTLNKENELTKFRYRTFIIISALLLIVLALIIIKFRSDSKRKAKEKDLRNRLLRLELQYNSERLSKSSLSILRKKEFSEELINRISNIKDINSSDKNSLKMYVINELEIDSTLLSTEKEIKEVGEEYIVQLKNKFPQLTDNDIQFLGFIKMKLTNKQVSEIKNITPDSVKTAKNRLRKKLNLPSGSNFFDHLEF